MDKTLKARVRATAVQAANTVARFNQRRRRSDQPNPFLEGVHTPLTAEVSLDALTVVGQIPPELNGVYVRNGPNPVSPPNPAAHHWFLGEGMVHGVRIRDGRALWYRNRWVRGRAACQALGEAALPGEPADFDAPNTNVIGHAGAIWAIVEAVGKPVRLDADLNSLAHDAFGGTLKGSFSAHPHRDPKTGALHAICYEATDQSQIRYVEVSADGRVVREQPIAVSHGPSIHDCMITANYVVIFDLPVTFSMATLLGGHPFPYRWNPAHPARVGLLPRHVDGQDVIWCAVDPCYVFHAANAYERDDGAVVIDVCAHDRMFAASNSGPDSSRAPFERWVADPIARTVARNLVDATNQEFPRINEGCTGGPYRYAYCVAFPDQQRPDFGADSFLIKHDLVAGTRSVHDFGTGKMPGEFVFVARTGAAAEDDGWLLGFVVDVDARTAELVILDAARFEGPPQARIAIPTMIPPGFHGNWIAA